MTDTFLELSDNPDSFTIDSIHMQRLERFHVIMYSKSCSAATVNQARQQLFSHGLRSLEAIPPSQAALFEHLRGQSFRHVSFGGRLQHVTRWSLTSAHGDGSSMRADASKA